MKTDYKNWTWFLLIVAAVLGMALFMAKRPRAEPGKSLTLSLEQYKTVDPALIHYEEVESFDLAVENPSALAVDAAGQIYVGGENVVAMVGETRVPVEGTPTCLAVDTVGGIYVGMTDRIILVPPSGERSTIEVPSERAFLTSLAVDENYIYAADAGSRKIWRFSRAGGEPFEIGRADGVGARGFNVPSNFFDLALASDGLLWAVNPGYHALEQYTADGQKLTSWEKSSLAIEGFAGCCNPTHIALLPDGGIVTAEKGVVRVKVYNPDGSLRSVVAAPDAFDDGVVGLDLAVDHAGRVLVLDPMRKQLRVFEEKP